MFDEFGLSKGIQRHIECPLGFGYIPSKTPNFSRFRFVDTSFATGDPRTQTIWSTKVFEFALQNMALTPMMGDTKDALIQVENRLLREVGDTIIFESRDPMSGAGQGDDGNTTGNEEAL